MPALRTGLIAFVMLLAAIGVLSFWGSTTAAPPEAQGPFSNAVEQRAEMVKLLTEVRDLLKEQNALLRSGEAQVMIVEPKKN